MPGGQLSDACQGTELDVARTEHMTGQELITLTNIQNRGTIERGGLDQRNRRDRKAGRGPRREPAAELAREGFDTNSEALAHDLVTILIVVGDEYNWPRRVDEPAQPRREHRPQLDRQRPRNMTGCVVIERARVNDL